MLEVEGGEHRPLLKQAKLTALAALKSLNAGQRGGCYRGNQNGFLVDMTFENGVKTKTIFMTQFITVCPATEATQVQLLLTALQDQKHTNKLR